MNDVKQQWYVIVNPTSGAGSAKKKWPKIEALLKLHHFSYVVSFTKYSKHEKKLLNEALNLGYRKIIAVGGDGTLHHIVNGILSAKAVKSFQVNVGVIPIGTGNDWVKTHNIPKNIEAAIAIIKNGNTKLQDIGEITLINNTPSPVYFINLAGIGFDGYVVKKVNTYKSLGSLAYLIGALVGVFSFKNFNCSTFINSKTISSKALMVLVGICKYSGGGMQLTKNTDSFDGLFDISVAKNFTKFDVVTRLPQLFNGKILNFKKVASFKSADIKVEVNDLKHPYIQADGELIGQGNFKATIIPKAFSFYSP